LSLQLVSLVLSPAKAGEGRDWVGAGRGVGRRETTKREGMLIAK
jgi:hypothetical protein